MKEERYHEDLSCERIALGGRAAIVDDKAADADFRSVEDEDDEN